jgi:hypothetical protein
MNWRAVALKTTFDLIVAADEDEIENARRAFPRYGREC